MMRPTSRPYRSTACWTSWMCRPRCRACFNSRYDSSPAGVPRSGADVFSRTLIRTQTVSPSMTRSTTALMFMSVSSFAGRARCARVASTSSAVRDPSVIRRSLRAGASRTSRRYHRAREYAVRARAGLRGREVRVGSGAPGRESRVRPPRPG